MHSFPLKQPDLLNHWLRNLRREDFTPTQHSRLCSLHFADSDFEQLRTDTNFQRSRNLSENRTLRRLKPDAVPRFFSGMPQYLLEDPPRSRSGAATSTARAEQDKQHHEEAEASFWDSDKVESCAEIEKHLKSDPAVPTGFCTVRNDCILALCCIEFDNDNIPMLNGSITIHESMEFCVVYQGKLIPAETFSEIVTSKIGTMSEVTNLRA